MASYSPLKKNTAQRIVFPILDADGDLVTGAATPDTEYSLDGGSFSDISDEAHEMATNSGIYYVDLAAGETNGDVVAIQCKCATAGAKTTALVFYTQSTNLDTVGTNVIVIKKVSINKWAIVGNQLIIYDDNKVDALYTFNLDNALAPTSRTPV